MANTYLKMSKKAVWRNVDFVVWKLYFKVVFLMTIEPLNIMNVPHMYSH